MRSLFFVLILLIMSNMVFAGRIFVGLQAGEANTHYGATDAGLAIADISQQNMMPRIYAGYAFNEQIALEAGFLPFRDTRLHTMTSVAGATGVNGVIQQRSYDLLAKASIRIQQCLYLYGKMGAAYLDAKPNAVLRTLSNNRYALAQVQHFRPAFAVGATYEIYDHWAVEGSWLTIISHRLMPRADYISVGIQYSFGAPFIKHPELIPA